MPASPAEPTTLDEALLALQADMPPIVKTKAGDTGSHDYMYADLADCLEVLYPKMTALGLAWSAWTEAQSVLVSEKDGEQQYQQQWGVTVRLVHVPSDQERKSFWPLASPQTT